MNRDRKRAGTGTPILVPVGERVLGRVLNAAGEPIDGLGPITGATKMPIDHPAPVPGDLVTFDHMLETGIKMIDLIAPLTRGGIHGVFGPTGVGKMVLLSELTHNVATHHGGYAIWIGLEERTHEVNDLMRVVRESGVHEQTAMVFGQRSASPAAHHQAVLTGLTMAEYFRDQDREVLLFVDAKLGLAGGVEDALQRIRTTKRGTISLVLFEPSDESPDLERIASLVHLDGSIVFTRTLFSQQIYPAIDPLSSQSRILDPQRVGEDHHRVACQVQQLLQRYHDLNRVIEEGGLDTLSDEDRQAVARARRIQLSLTQPFFVAEPFTDIPGEYVPIEETVKGFKGLVEGLYDEVPDEKFRMIGDIDQAVSDPEASRTAREIQEQRKRHRE